MLPIKPWNAAALAIAASLALSGTAAIADLNHVVQFKDLPGEADENAGGGNEPSPDDGSGTDDIAFSVSPDRYAGTVGVSVDEPVTDAETYRVFHGPDFAGAVVEAQSNLYRLETMPSPISYRNFQTDYTGTRLSGEIGINSYLYSLASITPDTNQQVTAVVQALDSEGNIIARGEQDYEITTEPTTNVECTYQNTTEFIGYAPGTDGEDRELFCDSYASPNRIFVVNDRGDWGDTSSDISGTTADYQVLGETGEDFEVDSNYSDLRFVQFCNDIADSWQSYCWVRWTEEPAGSDTDLKWLFNAAGGQYPGAAS